MAGSSLREAEVVWRVLPLQTPRVLRHCARCERSRPFASTDKFRLNAQQRYVDVWLLYACTHCDSTWKREVFVRRSPQDIGADLYERLMRNERETAWKLAFANGAVSAPADGGVCVERSAAVGQPHRIRLRVPYPCAMRLDRLLAQELGLSRGAVCSACRSGAIDVEPGGERALRRPVRDETVITLAPDELPPIAEPRPRGSGQLRAAGRRDLTARHPSVRLHGS